MKASRQKSDAEQAPVIYDADARNRFGYHVAQDGQNYPTAHIFEPLSDDRYTQWVREFNIKGNDEKMEEESREASIKLWDEIIFEVENIDVEGVEEWRNEIPFKEKIQALNDFLAVTAFQPETVADGKRRPRADATQVIITEAYFNGKVTTQTHTLKDATLEWEKKYARIQDKRFKKETTRGLRRKPLIEFIPQDAKVGELYDEMVDKTEGFAGRIPLRFKTAVIHHIFESTLEAEEKK